MITAFATPVLVPASGKEVLLERVPLSGPGSKATYDEKWLQNLLYRHPAAIPVAEIDDAFSSMVPVCQEMNTQAGPVDVVYVTRTGRPVLVEAKLWRNPEARRKVVAQILDYAKELSRWSFEEFDAAVRRARRAEDGDSPRSLYDLVGCGPDTSEGSEFHDSLTRSLRRGDLLLIVIGDGIREGVGSITEFLERHASLHFTFGLVEVAIYRMPGGEQLLQPRILAQSAIIKRMVVELRGEGIELRDEEEAEGALGDKGVPPELLRARERFEAFWRGFLERLRLDDRSQPVGRPGRAQNQFFKMPEGSESWISAYVSESQGRAGVYLTFSAGPVGDRLYRALEDDRRAIEREVGIHVDWEDDGSKHVITSSKAFTGRIIEDNADAAQRTLADWTNRYVNVFRPRLQTLVRDAGFAAPR